MLCSAGAHLIAQGRPYADSVAATIAAGGDQASRLLFAASFISALGGLDAIPADWTSKTSSYPSVLAWAQAVAAARK